MTAPRTPGGRDGHSDADIRAILGEARVIAMVGASSNPLRPSYFVMKYLQSKGYRVIPVNPARAGQALLGETFVASLADVPVPVDMVDIFRKPEAAGAASDEAIAIGARFVWMQLGIVDAAAAARAERAGLKVVMDRCPKIEYARLNGEIGWQGINSRVITSRRRPPARAGSPPPGVEPRRN